MSGLRNVLSAIALSAMAAAPAAAQSSEYIRIQNNSGYSIVTLQTSASSNNSWEADRLNGRRIANRSYYETRINNVIDCNYDFRVGFNDGDVMTFTVDICRNDVFTINP